MGTKQGTKWGQKLDKRLSRSYVINVECVIYWGQNRGQKNKVWGQKLKPFIT